MAEKAIDRLGVVAFGDGEAGLIGNILLYPRRTVLEVLSLLFQQEDLFTPIDAGGTATQRNPYLLVLDANGHPTPASRIVLADFGAESLNGEQRPRVIVDRQGGQFAGSGFSQQNSDQPWTGYSQRQSDLFETGVEIRCVSRRKLESECLGLIVGFALWTFRKAIMQKADIFQYGTPNISRTVPEKADAEGEQYVTTVSFSVKQTINWQVSQINETIVRDICVQVAL